MKKAISNKKEILYWLFLFLVISRLYPHLLPILTTYFRKKSFSALVEDKKPMSPALFRADQFESKAMEISQDIDKLQNKGSAELVEKILTKYGLHTYPEHAHNSAIKELIYNLLLNFLFYKRGLIYERSHKLSQAQADFSRITTNDKLDKFPRVKEFKGKEQAHIFKDWSSLHQLKNAAFMKSIYLEENESELSSIFIRSEQHREMVHQFATIYAFPFTAGGISQVTEDLSPLEIDARSIFLRWKEYWSKARSVFGGTISKEKVFACFMAGRKLPSSVGSHDDGRGVDKDKGQTKKGQAGDDHARNQGKLWVHWADENYETIKHDRLANYEKMFKIIEKLEASEAVSTKQGKDKSRMHSPNTQKENAKKEKEDANRERYERTREYQKAIKAKQEQEKLNKSRKDEQEKFDKLRTERNQYLDKWRNQFNTEGENDEKEVRGEVNDRETEGFGGEINDRSVIEPEISEGEINEKNGFLFWDKTTNEDREDDEEKVKSKVNDCEIENFGDEINDQLVMEPKISKEEINEKNRPLLWGEITNKEDNDDFGSNFGLGKGN